MSLPTILAPQRWVEEIHQNGSHMWDVCKETFRANWHLGFTAFGGPPVHFQIFHKKFVEKTKWIDEQTYQELFGISQALPGPASTKMLFCINSIHGGFASGLLAFCLWCLPGALGMYGLSLGVSRIGEALPDPVYALLSGLNAATVGIIALAAVQLAEKAITDKLTRLLVFLGGAAGMLYSSLWYFPVLMIAAGLTTITWDFRWLQKAMYRFTRRQTQEHLHGTETIESQSIAANQQGNSQISLRRSHRATSPSSGNPLPRDRSHHEVDEPVQSRLGVHLLTWKSGLALIACFMVSFVTIMTLRGTLTSPPLGLSLFANLYLAGTIIFGGGPVVIPLLRQYIVDEGWVSPRDFLLGLALIQSFPGPNFNFAVYLGSLTAARASLPSFAGAIIAFVGIFAPGLMIVTGIMGFWKALRSRRWVVSFLRGVNAGAVGLVYTAVYRLWQIGFVDGKHTNGSALGVDPWWVAITATSFVGGRWFGLSAPLAILLGGAMGVAWYGVVKA